MSHAETQFKTQCGHVASSSYVYYGFSAAFRHGDLEVILTSPTMALLREAWKRIATIQLNESEVRETFMGSPMYMTVTEETSTKPQTTAGEPVMRERKLRTVPPTKDDNPFDFVWYVHFPTRATGQTLRKNVSPDCEILGKSCKGTVAECRNIMRRLGWPKERILLFNIEDNDIPF